jgi:hypothetical protein
VICPSDKTLNCKWISTSALMSSLTSPSISESAWILGGHEHSSEWRVGRWGEIFHNALWGCQAIWPAHLGAAQWVPGQWPREEWLLLSIHGILKDDTAHLVGRKSPVASIFHKYWLLVPEHPLNRVKVKVSSQATFQNFQIFFFLHPQLFFSSYAVK